MNRYSAPLLLSLALSVGPTLPAAQLSGWRDKLKDLTKSTPGATSPLAQAGDMAYFLTIATDQGMKALDEIAAAFPPDKIAAFQHLSTEYKEAKASRVDGNIDADSFMTASKAAAEIAKLESDWQSYRKEGAKSVRKADARLGLMLLADGEASEKAPTTVRGLQAETKVAFLKKDTEKLDRIKKASTFLTCVIDQAPHQTQSFQTVRRIAKNIANAEHYQLAPDPAPETVSTAGKMSVAAQKIDADIPPQGS